MRGSAWRTYNPGPPRTAQILSARRVRAAPHEQDAARDVVVDREREAVVGDERRWHAGRADADAGRGRRFGALLVDRDHRGVDRVLNVEIALAVHARQICLAGDVQRVDAEVAEDPVELEAGRDL